MSATFRKNARLYPHGRFVRMLLPLTISWVAFSKDCWEGCCRCINYMEWCRVYTYKYIVVVSINAKFIVFKIPIMSVFCEFHGDSGSIPGYCFRHAADSIGSRVFLDNQVFFLNSYLRLFCRNSCRNSSWFADISMFNVCEAIKFSNWKRVFHSGIEGLETRWRQSPSLHVFSHQSERQVR